MSFISALFSPLFRPAYSFLQDFQSATLKGVRLANHSAWKDWLPLLQLCHTTRYIKCRTKTCLSKSVEKGTKSLLLFTVQEQKYSLGCYLSTWAAYFLLTEFCVVLFAD